MEFAIKWSVAFAIWIVCWGDPQLQPGSVETFDAQVAYIFNILRPRRHGHTWSQRETDWRLWYGIVWCAPAGLLRALSNGGVGFKFQELHGAPAPARVRRGDRHRFGLGKVRPLISKIVAPQYLWAVNSHFATPDIGCGPLQDADTLAALYHYEASKSCMNLQSEANTYDRIVETVYRYLRSCVGLSVISEHGNQPPHGYSSLKAATLAILVTIAVGKPPMVRVAPERLSCERTLWGVSCSHTSLRLLVWWSTLTPLE